MKLRKQNSELSKASLKGVLRKGGVTMKTTSTVRIMFLTLAVLAVLCTPLMTRSVDAQAYSSYTGAHHAIAYLAEKEIREKELKAQANQNDTIVAKTEIAGDQNDPESGPEKSVPQTKEKETR